MHAFTCNVSDFFRKGKQTIWKLLLKDERFVETFANLGLFSSPTDEIRNALEEFVCVIYGDKKCDSVDQMRVKVS